MYLIIKTCSNDIEILENISKIILKNKLSPCVHIIKNVKSKYIWKNNLTEDLEHTIEIKTSNKFESQICNIIKENHNYDTPEIISFCAQILDKEYEKWFNQCIK